MTWLEWVNSDFNTGNYEIVDETCISCGALIITDEDYSNQNYNDSIESYGFFIQILFRVSFL